MRIELRREQADYLRQVIQTAEVARAIADAAIRAHIAGAGEGAKIQYDLAATPPFIEITEKEPASAQLDS